MKKKFYYSILSKNRGAFFSVLVVLALVVVYGAGFAHPKGLPWLMGFAIIFIIGHLYWDFSIRDGFHSFDYEEGRITVKVNGLDEVYSLNDVESAEIFPQSDNVYDDDFIGNIMSSGVRLKFRDGRKFLVFTKLRGYRNFLAILNENLSKKGVHIEGHQ